MSNKNTIEEEKYYVPFCREKGCNGHLYTQLDENFSDLTVSVKSIQIIIVNYILRLLIDFI